MIDVQIDEALENAHPGAGKWAPALQQAAEVSLALSQAPEAAELTILLSDDRRLQELNRQFLEIDAPTDVLSFPAGDLLPEDETVYLGDIIISLERAEAQAAAGGHVIAHELQLLVVHGVLHLLGLDHATAEEKAAMWALQAAALNQLGINLTPP
ncbi:MAG TPA: rRNA maturation RNase YbeY [Anaerolineales bacterium]|nr:rRNA maturation RNase YbeY [Anaerolineales bacterium]